MRKSSLVIAGVAATVFAAGALNIAFANEKNGQVMCDGAWVSSADECTKMGGKVMETKNGQVKCDGAKMKADDCKKMNGKVKE